MKATFVNTLTEGIERENPGLTDTTTNFFVDRISSATNDAEVSHLLRANRSPIVHHERGDIGDSRIPIMIELDRGQSWELRESSKEFGL